MTKTYEVIRATSGADEFDGDVFQVAEWTLGYLMDNAENKHIDMFYALPAGLAGEDLEQSIISWARRSVRGKFRIEEVE